MHWHSAEHCLLESGARLGKCAGSFLYVLSLGLKREVF